MITALFGLLGVIIGGLITFLTSSNLERRRERRDDDRERKRRATELKTAIRLTLEEFVRAAAACQLATEDKKQWWEPPNSVNTDSWTQSRASLAAEVPSGVWISLTNAAFAEERLIQFRAEALAKHETAPSDWQSKFIAEHVLPNLREAAEHLRIEHNRCRD